MKSTTFILLAIWLFITTACEKENERISYPNKGVFGENILHADSITVEGHEEFQTRSVPYSIRANIPEDQHVKVVIKQRHEGSERNWLYAIGTGVGWTYISEYNNATLQGFGPVVSDIRIQFEDTGSIDIEVYENGATEPIRVKSIAWELGN